MYKPLQPRRRLYDVQRLIEEVLGDEGLRVIAERGTTQRLE
jgi:hypothetical protein